MKAVFIIILCLGFSSAHLAFAASGVYGNTNFSSFSEKDTRPVGLPSAKKQWQALLGVGVGVSQIVKDVPSSNQAEVVDNQFQMNLNFLAERMLLGNAVGAETGVLLGTQFLSPALTAGKDWRIRYIDIPLLLRAHLSKRMSLSGGTFASVPLTGEDSLEPQHRLNGADLGFMGSARFSITQSKVMDWILETTLQRGLTHIGGNSPNHLRNFIAMTGISAKL